MSSKWDQIYRDTERLWDCRPDVRLASRKDLVPPGRVLDLGLGEGRDALYFAHCGFEVTGVDLSEAAVERVRKAADNQKLSLEAEVSDARDFNIQKDFYSLVIAHMVLQFMTATDSSRLIQSIKSGLIPGGVVSIRVFSTQDPSYIALASEGAPIEENTFYSRTLRGPVHFFTKLELADLCEGCQLVYMAEEQALDLSHGAPHYHSTISYIGRKEISSASN